MSYRHALLVLVATLLACLPGAPARAGEGSTDVWDQMRIDGARAGTVQTVVRTVEADGAKRIETVVVTDMKMKRMGATTEIKSTSTTWEGADGRLLRIASSQKMSSQVSDSVFTFGEGKVTIETTVMGNKRTVEQPAAGDLIGPNAQQAKLKALAGTKDKSDTFATYVSDFQRVVNTTFTSRGVESTELLGGRTANLTRIDATLEGVPIKPVSWIDAEGQTQKTMVEMVGMKFVTYRVGSRAEALEDGPGVETAPEVFNATLLQEDDPIPVPRQLDGAVVLVKKRTADAELPDMSSAGHVVKTLADGSLEITATRVVPPAGKYGTRPMAAPAADLVDDLAPSSVIQSDAEELRKTAEDVVGTETQAWPAAQKLERWVFENITKKSMGVGFASALESFQTREGDCTEHSVLLAALCRAAGIPARVVMGLEYLMGVWGGHAWNEVWIEGTWYPLDATNGYGFVDPLHLPMAHMTMKEGGASEFTELLLGMGHMDVDIVSVVRDGRTIKVCDSGTLVTTADGVYRNPIWGLQLKIPAGWVLDLPTKRKALSARLLELDGKTAEGKPVEIEVDVMDEPARGGLAGVVTSFGLQGAAEGKVDGRPSMSATVTRGGKTKHVVLCLADKALYIFALDRPDGAAEQAAFKAVLESVDFDVR